MNNCCLRMRIVIMVWSVVMMTSCNGKAKPIEPIRETTEASTKPTTDTSSWYGPGDIVQDIFLDKGGNLWFGTNGGEGLFLFNHALGKFTNYTFEEGLCNNQVGSIFQDRDGIMWFGTEDGVCRYDSSATTAGKQAFTRIDIPPH